MFVFVLVLCGAVSASGSKVRVTGEKFANYGGEAHFKCELEDPKDVLQVTWQRVGANSFENMATYNKRFGEKVNGPYVGKIQFTETSLSSTSITVRNVTWTDESCYVCVFNTYPGGAIQRQACLKVHGVSDVKTRHSTDENMKVTISCSATGKPAPKIEWKYSHEVQDEEQSETSVLSNADRTLSSSRNVTLRLPPGWNGHVDCVINPGMSGGTIKTFPFTRPEEKTENVIYHIVPIIVGAISVLLILFTVIGFLFWTKRLRFPSCEHTVV